MRPMRIGENLKEGGLLVIAAFDKRGDNPNFSLAPAYQWRSRWSNVNPKIVLRLPN